MWKKVELLKNLDTFFTENVADNGVLKGCIFVGANASGKSTIILGIKQLLDLLFSERNLNSGMFRCIFGERRQYSLEYEFLIENKTIKYFFEIGKKNTIYSEKLYLDGAPMLERMGLNAKSYIVEPNGVTYDQEDVVEDTLFLRTLYFNTKFASNPVLSAWIDYLKKSVYINLFDKKIITYGAAEVSALRYLDNGGCEAINNFFNEYNFEQNIEYEHSSQGGGVVIVVGNDESEKDVFFKRKGVDIPIPFGEESLGNQNLIRILPAFLTVIKNDGMLLIDEFSSGFHNDLERLLVRYFMQNANHAQMLFVSHSTNLLSNSIPRPDQEYAVEFRNEDGSSVKRFSSEQPRSAQNIEKMYVSGVFGGLPDYKEVNEETE